jgi:mRNA interferase HigB
MRVIAVSTLRSFWEQSAHKDAEHPLKAWVAEMNDAQWHEPSDVKALFRSASILKAGRVVFNIKGNDCRLVAAVSYKLQIVFVKFIGTHRAYDKIDAQTVELD